MKTTTQLLNQRINQTQSLLCVGLDPQPEILAKMGMTMHLVKVNIAIIDTVAEFACAFKPQFAHYAALGEEKALEETCYYIKQQYPAIPLILDAKRGDIGSTADKYAVEAFGRYHADAVTINPYMGMDTVAPYFRYTDKAGVVLVKTSNPGSADIQNLQLDSGERLYKAIASRLADTFPAENLWFVVGGTHPETLLELRQAFPDITFLVPGVGVQGGDIAAIIQSAMIPDGTGVLINVSRGITAPADYCSTLDEYIKQVHVHAKCYYQQIRQHRTDYLKR